MPNDADSFDEWTSRPFQPVRLHRDGPQMEVGERVVEALEYIAAQLGEISRKMDHVGSGFTASKEDLEQMKDLLRKL